MSANSMDHSNLLAYVDLLGSSDQAKVIDYARKLAASSHRGTPGKTLLKFSGSISSEDAAQIVQAIEEGCEQTDVDSW